jgi:hypothetical protein
MTEPSEELGSDNAVHNPKLSTCDECDAPAVRVHLLPSGDQPERLSLACDRHDPGGEWWSLTELGDVERALRNASVFDRLRPDFSRALRTVRHELQSDAEVAEVPEPVVPGSVPGTKACPRCAEDVKLAAQVCRFCGHEFGGASGQSGPGSTGSKDLLPVAIAIFGAILLVIAPFLPLDEPAVQFRYVSENTLIQHGGWTLIVLGLAIAIAVYRPWQRGDRGGGAIYPALIAAGIVVLIASDTSLRTLYPVGLDGAPNTSLPGTVVGLGVAVYMAAAGAAISFIGAFMQWRE